MSYKCELSKKALDKLVCTSCNNYLSIYPIYLKPDNSGVICGRCTPLDKSTLIRDAAYEAIAEFLLFPCCFKADGCEEKLSPHMLKEHESTCRSRNLECPTKIFTKCEWLGAPSDLVVHFENIHAGLLLKNPEIRWDFATTHKENVLLPFEDELFVIKLEADARRETFTCSMEVFGKKIESTIYSNYTIKFLSDNKDYFFKFQKRINYDELIVSKCDINEKLNDPNYVIIQIGIVKQLKEIPMPGKSNETKKNPNLNWKLLEELECPVCYNYMRFPIYQCTTGHSICSECKPGLPNCPLCKEDMLNTRNFSLEKLAHTLKYPCRFYNSGCTYICKSAEIKKHEEKCEFGPCDCPLKGINICSEKINRSQMVAHVEEKHSSFILKSNKITTPYNPGDEYIYLMKFCDLLFIIRYRYTNKKFYWAVQLVGSSEESKKFTFDIDIIDSSKSGLRCYLKGLCTSVQEKVDFLDPRKYVVITQEQIDHLIANMLNYYIHISES